VRRALLFLAACGRIGFQETAATDAQGSNGPSVWLEMETDPTMTIVDSARGHTVICTAACPALTAGYHGMGYQFSGQQLRIHYSSDLDATLGYTAAAWARLDVAPTGDACVFTKPWGPTTADSNTFALCVDASQRLYNYTVYASGADDVYGGQFPIGSWHHIAVTWDSLTHVQTLYRDGAMVAQDVAQVAFDSDDECVGSDNLLPLYPWQGAIDDVIFYDHALDAGEIQVLATP
jgi:hypothetical protein